MRFVVGLIQSQPGHVVTGLAGPFGQQGGLAPSGGSDNEAQPPGLVQHVEQAVPGHNARLEEWRSELSGQQCLRRLLGT
jgi:hypothetical protein